MELSTQDTILVVSEREFLVNRNSLVENSPYFRAMLEGGFKEASSNRVELKGLCSADAFEVLLDYILNKRIRLKAISRLLLPVLTLSDMLNDDMFPVFLTQELFQKWTELDSAETILLLANTLDVRASLLYHIFGHLQQAFIERGLHSVTQKESSLKCQNDYLSVLDSRPDLIVDIFAVEEAANFCFSDFKNVDMCFAKGAISWVLDKELDELGICNVVRCLGIQCLCEDSLMEVIANLPQSEQKYLLETQVKCHIDKTRNNIRNTVSTLCAGWAINALEMFHFDFENWKWHLIGFHKTYNVCTSSPTNPNDQTTNSEDPINVNVSTWYTERTSLSFEVPCDDHPMYCAGLHVGDESQRLLVFELKYGKKRYSTIFRTPIPGRILGCHLFRLDDDLHGFVSYSPSDNLTTVGHFILKRNSEDETWFNSEFRLEPLLVDLQTRITPVATAMSKKGILVLFRRDQEYLWLAVYNLQTGLLAPLGHTPMPRKSEQGTRSIPKEGDFEETAQRICTFNFACCCCSTWAPIFHLSSFSDRTSNHVTSPFFYGFDRCAINGHHHTPQLKSVINVCYSTY